MTFSWRWNLLKNSLGIFFSRILTTLAAFICIPIVVSKLGIEGYGTWESIVAVSILCNIFQVTISGTLLWVVSNAYGSKDMENIRQYVQMGISISLLLFLIFTPAAWGGRHFLVRLFKVPQMFVPTATWILPCVVGLMLLNSANEILGALIGGFQRAGITTLIQAISIIANNLVVIFCLMLGFGFWSLLIGFMSGFIVSASGLFAMANRICGRFSLRPRFPTRSVLKKLAPYAGFLLLGAVSMAFRDQVDKIILSSIASPAWTGYYGIAVRLAGLVMAICAFFYVPTIAASGAMYSNGDWPGIHRIYDDVIMVTSFLVGLVVVLLAGLHDRLVFLWIGRPIPEVGAILYLLLIGNTVAVLLTGTGSSVCKGIGIVKIETIYIVFGLILNILLKVTLVPLIGAIGTVVSSAGSWTVSSIVFVILLHRQTSMRFSSTMKAVKTMLIIVGCVFIARCLSAIFPVETDRLSVLFSSIKLVVLLTLIFTLMMILWKVVTREALRQFRRFVKTYIFNRFKKA